MVRVAGEISQVGGGLSRDRAGKRTEQAAEGDLTECSQAST